MLFALLSLIMTQPLEYLIINIVDLLACVV